MSEAASSLPLPFVVNAFLAARLLEAWRRIRWDQEVADRCLASICKRDRLGSRDRRRLSEATFMALRRRAHTDATVGLERSRDAAHLGLWLSTALQQALPGQPEPLPFIPSTGDDPVVDGNLPPPLVRRLETQMDEPDLMRLGHAMRQRGPITLRASAAHGGRLEVAARLRAAGCATQPSPYAPHGLICDDRRSLNAVPKALRGQFAIQDEGSQLLAMMVGAQAGEHILDACAGAGGKTLALLETQARVDASDVDRKRLNILLQRAHQAGWPSSALSLVDTEAWCDKDETYDRVLVDAPCTGSGTGRRSPDLLWRFNDERLAHYCELQGDILKQTAALVKPGGRLIYATCSLAPEENAKQIEQFLRARPDYRQVTPAETLGADLAAELGAGPWLELMPHRHNTDGFFAALLARERAD